MWRSLKSLEKSISLCLYKQKPGEKNICSNEEGEQNVTLYAILQYHAALGYYL